MADSAVAITAGAGTNIDTRTEGTNSNHRQVIVIGDPATNAGVAPVDATNGLSVTLTTAIPAGSATIGKLAANSGVDIGDVDVTSLPNTKASTAALSNVAGSASSVTLKAANADRRALIIVNESSATLYIKFGATASATDYTYQLQAGDTHREELYTGIVDGIWASATGAARVTELTV